MGILELNDRNIVITAKLSTSREQAFFDKINGMLFTLLSLSPSESRSSNIIVLIKAARKQKNTKVILTELLNHMEGSIDTVTVQTEATNKFFIAGKVC